VATTLEQVKDHQAAAGSIATRDTRLSINVDNNGVPLKDAALVFQKGLNHRFGDGSAVPNIASEGQGIPEDSHDAGQMAINYGSEPMWYRFGFKADAPFEKAGLGGEPDSHLAFSNSQVGGDPVTPVITATPNQDLRIRVPYICDDAIPGGKDGLPGRCATDNAAAPTKIGNNLQAIVLGHQESVTPGAHFDIVPLNGAGGVNGVKGDFLYSDQGSFGPTSGLWGILRVQP